MENIEQIKEVLTECYIHTKVAGRVLFPDRFYRPFDKLHKEIFDFIDNTDSQRLAIAAPRGIGKTSINNLLLPAKYALFQDTDYIVPVSASATSAQQQAENLKYELMNNPVINKLFDVRDTKNFSKTQWVVNVAGKDICVMPRGAGQQIRGLLYRNSRPGLIVVDDLEDPDHMDSEEQRAKKKEWFYADLMNSVDRGRDDWKIIVLGTVLHHDALLVNLLESKHWASLKLSIADPTTFHSNAPNFMSDQQIKDLLEEFEDEGKVDTFYREYMNEANPGGKYAAFQSDFFKYYEERDYNLSNSPDVENLVLVDPARTTDMKAADSAIVGVAINPNNQSIYVRDVVAGKYHPDELLDETFAMVDRINARVLGVEVTGLHEFVTYPIRNEIVRRRSTVDFVELQARAGVNERGKVERVRSLVQFYRRGLVYHNKAVCRPLEAQLLSFPRAKRWDIMDALGYAVEMLEKGERYMMPAKEEDFEDDPKAIEREYRELYESYDEPIDNFRII